jgi:NAD(P)-dependent dehydrogenase (short-subunit alcohol dehydrogenase family)
VPLIKRHGEGGHIVSTASMAGMIAGAGAQYAVTKFGVVALSESLRPELAMDNIGVSVLCPGFIRTNIMDSGRNLPPRFAGTNVRPMTDWTPPNAAQAEVIATVRKRVSEGIDPLYVGDLVREAIEIDELYIFTDTEFEPVFDMRVAGIKSGFERIRGRKPRH